MAFDNWIWPPTSNMTQVGWNVSEWFKLKQYYIYDKGSPCIPKQMNFGKTTLDPPYLLKEKKSFLSTHWLICQNFYSTKVFGTKILHKKCVNWNNGKFATKQGECFKIQNIWCLKSMHILVFSKQIAQHVYVMVIV